MHVTLNGDFSAGGKKESQRKSTHCDTVPGGRGSPAGAGYLAGSGGEGLERARSWGPGDKQDIKDSKKHVF